MAFIIEDGTGVADANSYGSVANYRAYWLDRGRDLSGQPDPDIQGYLVRATDFIESNYGTRWRGSRSTLVQALGHPRSGIYIDSVLLPSDSLSAQLQNATYEYAYRASKYAELAPDSPVGFDRLDNNGDVIDANGIVIQTSEKVGPLSESKTFSDPTASSNSASMPRYPAADALLASLVTGTTGTTIRA